VVAPTVAHHSGLAEQHRSRVLVQFAVATRTGLLGEVELTREPDDLLEVRNVPQLRCDEPRRGEEFDREAVRFRLLPEVPVDSGLSPPRGLARAA
jgi:hypothetical protein